MSMFSEDNTAEEEFLIPETDGEKILRLKDRIIELESMVRAIEIPLINAGYIDKPMDDKKANFPNPGIHLKGQLSFRGMQKAEEYWALLRDKNTPETPFGFEDFRAMCSISEPLGVVHGQETIHWESWKMYMADCGMRTDDLGHIGPQEFVKYRSFIETRGKPLLPELYKIPELGILPSVQAQWSLVKVLIKEAIEHRTQNHGMLPALGKAGSHDHTDECLNIDEIMFVLHNAGISFAKSEFFKKMLEKARFDAVMVELIARSLKKNFGASPERFSNLILEQYEHQQYVQYKIAKKKERERQRKAEEAAFYRKNKGKKSRLKFVSQLPPPTPRSSKSARRKRLKQMEAPDVVFKDMNYIKPSKLIAWLFCRRPEPTYPSLYQKMLQFKYATWRIMRKSELFFYHVSLMGAHFKQRKLFLDFKQEVYMLGNAHNVAMQQANASMASANKAAAERMKGIKSVEKAGPTAAENLAQRHPPKPSTSSSSASGSASGTRKGIITDHESDESGSDDDHQQQGKGSKSTNKKGNIATAATAATTPSLLDPHPYSRLKAKDTHKNYKDRKDVKSTVDICVDVGKTQVGQEGTSISFKLARLDKPDLYFMKQKLPRECTSAVMVDLLIRSGVDDSTIQKAAISLKIFMTNHFGDEMQHHPLFRGFFVYPIESELDGSLVLRVAVAYKKMSIDSYLEQLYIPFSLCDLVSDFRGEIQTNIHIIEMLTNSTASLDSLFTAKLDFTTSYKRELIIPLLERVQQGLSASITESLVRAMEEGMGFHKTQHKEYVDEIKEQQEKLKAQAAGKATGPEVKKPPVPGAAAAAANASQEEFEFHMADIWKEIRPFFAPIAEYATLMINRLRGIKDTTMRYKFTNLSELLFRWGLMNRFVKNWLPKDMARSHSMVTASYARFTNYFNTNLGQIFGYAKAYLESKAEAAEQARRQALFRAANPRKKSAEASSDRNQDDDSEAGGTDDKEDDDEDDDGGGVGTQSEAMVERLNRLGINANSTELYEGDDSKPGPTMQRLSEKIVESDIQALMTWERVWNCCLGIHNVEIVSGKSRLVFACQGLDIMELFSPPPPITAAKKSCDERKSMASGALTRKDRRAASAASAAMSATTGGGGVTSAGAAVAGGVSAGGL